MMLRHVMVFLGLCLVMPALAQVVTLPQLLDQLHSPDAATRTKAAQSLGKRRVREAVEPLIAMMEKDVNPLARAQAAASLGYLRDPRAVPALCVAMTDPFQPLRIQAVTALGMLGDPAAVEPLCAALRDPQSGVHDEAIAALGRIGDDAAADVLIGLLEGATPDRRAEVLKALVALQGPKATMGMVKLAQGEDIPLRCFALRAMAKSGDPRAFDALLAALDAPFPVNAAAADGLRGYSDPRALPGLQKLFAGKDDTTRQVAFKALVKITDPAVTQMCITALRDADAEIAAEAATALGRIGDPQAIPALLQAAMATREGQTEEQKRAMDAAADALRRFGDPAFDAIVQEMQPEKRLPMRYRAMTLMRYWHSQRANEVLLGCIHDDNPGIAFNAAAMLTLPLEVPYVLSSSLTGPQEPIAFVKRLPARKGPCQDTQLADYVLEGMKAEDSNIIGRGGALDDPRMITPLIALIKNPEERMRDAAVRALGSLAHPAALEPLLGALNDSTISYWAIYAIANLRDPLPLEPMLRALQNPDAQTRKYTAAALGMRGDARAVPALIDLRHNDKAPEVREYAALALGMIGDARAVPELINGLKDPVEWARSAAAWAVGQVGDTRGIAPLHAGMTPNDGRFNVRIGRSLVQLGDPQGTDLMIAAMESPDEMTRAIAAVSLRDLKDVRVFEGIFLGMEDKSWWVNGSITGTIEEIADPQAIPYLLMLLTAYRDGLDSDRQEQLRQISAAAARALGNIGDPSTLPALARLYADVKDDSIGLSVAAALVKLGDARGLPAVLEALMAPKQGQRATALLTLGSVRPADIDRLEYRQAVAPLSETLRDADPLMRVLAARALARYRDPRGAEALLAVLTPTCEPVVAFFAARYLGELHEGRAVQPLLALLPQQPVYVQQEICAVLARLGDVAATEPLVALLAHEDPRLRGAAAGALGDLGNPAAVARLLAVLHDESPCVREQAARALGLLKDRRAEAPLTALLREETATRVQTAAKIALKTLTEQK